jgi:ubiquinone/menaquinone biosynthesis C-methylase UbiE
MEKHYDINYLQNTRRLLEDLKKLSYQYFDAIEHGTIVDLGCGAGNDVIELAKLISQEVRVVGVDHDPRMVEQGKSASQNMHNVDFILSEASPLPFESDSVAGLRTERVIQHLKNPDKVIDEIRRILIKGHPFVIIETDWNSLAFYTSFTKVELAINKYLTETKINNGFAARKLVSYLQNAGFENITFDIYPFVIKSLADANEYFLIETILSEITYKGYITESESNDFYKTLESASDNGNFACSINLVISSCIK